MDILIKGMEMPKSCDECELLYDFVYCIVTKQKMLDADFEKRNPSCPLVSVPEHNDLADKSVIIERMGEVYEALYDKVDKKALSECHVAFLKAVMYAPTVIPSTVKISTEGIEPKGVWDETLTTDAEGERTT